MLHPVNSSVWLNSLRCFGMEKHSCPWWIGWDNSTQRCIWICGDVGTSCCSHRQSHLPRWRRSNHQACRGQKWCPYWRYYTEFLPPPSLHPRSWPDSRLEHHRTDLGKMVENWVPAHERTTAQLLEHYRHVWEGFREQPDVFQHLIESVSRRLHICKEQCMDILLSFRLKTPFFVTTKDTG